MNRYLRDIIQGVEAKELEFQEWHRRKSFHNWPIDGCSPWILPKIGLVYDGFCYDVRCVSCKKTSSMMPYQSLKATVNIRSFPENVRFALHDLGCPWLHNGERRNLPITYDGISENCLTLSSDHTVPQNRMDELRDIKRLTNEDKHFGNDRRTVIVTLCPCPPCLIQYSSDKELLLERLLENHELRALITSSKMSSKICLDPNTYRQEEVTRRSSGCGYTKIDNGLIVCAACKTEILSNGDVQNLAVLHTWRNPTCSSLQLLKGYTFIHKALQDLKISIKRKDSSMQMESCITLINVYADNIQRDHLCPEMTSKIVSAAIDYFFLHDGRFGNAADIAEILEQ